MLHPVSCDWFFLSYALSFDLGLSFYIHMSVTLSFDLGLTLLVPLYVGLLLQFPCPLNVGLLLKFPCPLYFRLLLQFPCPLHFGLSLTFFSCAMFTLMTKLYELFRGNPHWHYSLAKYSLLQESRPVLTLVSW